VTARQLDSTGLAALGGPGDSDVVARYAAKVVGAPGSEWLGTGAVAGRCHRRFWIAPGEVVISHPFGFAAAHGSRCQCRAKV
jgi:hypothetical protein